MELQQDVETILKRNEYNMWRFFPAAPEILLVFLFYMIIIIIFIHKFTPWLFASFVCVSARGFKPITKVDTHDSRRPYYVANTHTHTHTHTQIPRAILVYLEHTKEMHIRIFSLEKQLKKNGGQKQKIYVILTTTTRKALRFRKKKAFFFLLLRLPKQQDE